MNYKIIWIDDELNHIKHHVNWLRKAGETVVAIESPAEGLDYIRRNAAKIKLVISDLQMAKMDGLKLRQELLQEYSTIPFILVSGHITRELALTGMENKIARFVEKPVDIKMLNGIIAEVCRDRVSYLEDQRHLTQCFIDESLPLLDELESLNMSFEEESRDPQILRTYLRILHTLKGTSDCIGLQILPRFFHRFEDFISELDKNRLAVNERTLGIMFKGVDSARRLFEALREDKLLELQTEELIHLFDLKVEELQGGAVSVDNRELTKRIESFEDEKIPIAAKDLDQFLTGTGKITIIRRMIESKIEVLRRRYFTDSDVLSLSDFIDEMQKENQLLQNRSEVLRKVSLDQVFKPLKRIVRDLAKNLKKKVQFTTQGGGLMIDRSIAKALNKALIHVVRNSLDHGIELPELRLLEGKPESGSLTFSAEIRDEMLKLKMSDDGKGMDPKKIRQKALVQKLVTEPELSKLSDQEVLAFIFQPGFSTAENVTSVSGRGVGMDMVKSVVEGVNGTLDLSSEIGKGCQFLLQIPLPKSFLVLKAIYARCLGHSIAVPRDEVITVANYEAMAKQGNIQIVEGAEVFCFQDKTIRILDLSKILRYNESSTIPNQSNSEKSILVVGNNRSLYGLCVDQVLSLEEIVIKDMDIYSRTKSIFTKVTLIGDEGLTPIMDLDCIDRLKRRGELQRKSFSEVADLAA